MSLWPLYTTASTTLSRNQLPTISKVAKKATAAREAAYAGIITSG
jgi:hypothetical protein